MREERGQREPRRHEDYDKDVEEVLRELTKAGDELDRELTKAQEEAADDETPQLPRGSIVHSRLFVTLNFAARYFIRVQLVQVRLTNDRELTAADELGIVQPLQDFRLCPRALVGPREVLTQSRQVNADAEQLTRIRVRAVIAAGPLAPFFRF